MKKKLYVVKIFREPLAFDEVCQLYCWGKNPVELEKRVFEFLKANHDLKKLGFKEELISFQTYPVEKKNVEVVRRFCSTFEI